MTIRAMPDTLRAYVRGLAAKYGHTQRTIAAGMRKDEGELSRSLAASPRPATLDALCVALGCDSDERLEVYRLAGKVPPEILRAFCSSAEASREFRKVARVMTPGPRPVKWMGIE